MANGEGNGKKDDKGSGAGLAILGLGVLAAGAAALYFLTRKPSCPEGQQYDETSKTCIPIPPGGGGGAATSFVGFNYACSPGPCAVGSIIAVGGQLVDPNKVPVAGATVRIVVTNAGGSSTATAVTDSAGQFFITNPIVSAKAFTLQAVFDGDATKQLAGATSPLLTVTPGPSTCTTNQYNSGPMSYQSQYIVDLGEPILLTQLNGSWRKGGAVGTTRLRAAFDDGTQVEMTGCVAPQGIGIFGPLTVNKFTRYIRFYSANFGCDVIPGYIDEISGQTITCKPGGATQTCAAQGGSCGTPDACVSVGGTAIASTDCPRTCCKR